ncbi:hypothetical protein EMIT0P260_50392 [Pseudomonas sp. IT-P260]
MRVVRSNSFTPRASSSFSMRRLKAGCDRRTVSAALRKLPCSTTARKACRSLRSKLMAMADSERLIREGYQCNHLMQIITDLHWLTVGAAEGCDLLILFLKIKRSQPSAAPARDLRWILNRFSLYPCHPPPYRCQESTHAP